MWRIIILIAMLYSCKHESKSKYEAYFSPDNLSHFPKKHNSDLVSTSFFYPKLSKYQHSGVFLRKTFRFKKNVIDTLINNLKKTNPIILNHDDSCNLYIELYYNHGLNRTNECEKHYPVPNFWEELAFIESKDNKYLPRDFDLYIIELKKGSFIPEKNLFNKDELFGSSEWKNGISKGVAISRQKNICIYWLEIW
jgi:hypothetical protein